MRQFHAADERFSRIEPAKAKILALIGGGCGLRVVAWLEFPSEALCVRAKVLRCAAVLGICVFARDSFAGTRPCYDMLEAGRHLNQDVCVRAHVYDVIELADGTRFLDVCSPETSDAACRFTIISLRQDRKEVGDLGALRSQQIEIRGTVHSFANRSGIILSEARQLHGGAEKFHPNPALLKGFSAADGKSAFEGPAFKSGGHHQKSSSPPTQ